MREKVRIGLIGAGEMGVLHLQVMAAHPGVSVAGVCDVDEAARRRAEEQGLPTYSDWRELIETERPDAVIVATPPHQHAEPAIHALQQGLHVLLEKPMAATLEEALRIHEAAQGTGRLMVAFSLRFHGLYQRIWEHLQELGPVIFQWHVALGRMPRNSWVGSKEKSGGMINENAVHILYAFLWYAGEVEEASARCWTLGEGRTIEDSAVVQLVHKDGAVSTLLQTWAAQHRLRGWGLQARRGTATVDGYLGGRYRVSKAGMQLLEEEEFTEPVEEMYRRQLAHFLECITRGERPVVNEEDGLRIQRLVEAIYRSSEEGRPVRVGELR
jgi:predicted dehydrogenase